VRFGCRLLHPSRAKDVLIMSIPFQHVGFCGLRAFAAIALFAAAVAGCGTPKGPPPTANVEVLLADESGSRREISEINQKLLASVSTAPNLRDYVLGEGDLIQVTVFEAEELKTEARVGSRGFITLPLLGPVQIKGLTTREAEQRIEDLYKRKYLQNPHVSIFVKEQLAGKITLLGAVKNPGAVPYLTRQRLLDSLAGVGGLSEKAGKMVQVRRPNDDPKLQPMVFMIDLDEIIKQGNTDLNIEIQRGDVIFVPEAGTIYVDGAVKKPGNYSISQSTTVQEAIVMAGGFSLTADEGNIKLVRVMPSGKREVVKLSISDIQQGSAHSMSVKDRDVLFVETNTPKALLYGLRLNLGGGLFGIGYDPRSGTAY